MSRLTLRAGPVLVFEHDGERHDLFALLGVNPVLLEAFRRDYALTSSPA
mgnify:CR=1 FL=1